MSARNAKLGVVKSALSSLRDLARSCRLCMHKCKVNRLKNEKGICKAGEKIAVYSYSPHHGEEPPLSGTRGSGAIFFTHCNMKCAYCQNYTFSQESDRRESRAQSRNELEETGAEKLADRMLELQRMGCHNINFVSPTHYAYQIVQALEIAFEKGLNLPLIYNTGGHDNLRLIKLLDGIIDIYMPDMRYADDKMAEKYSSAPDYAENNRSIVKEMFRQAGPLETDKNAIAKKGVIVRLLILPENTSGTLDTLRFLKSNVSDKIYLSVMSQYWPTYKASSFPEIARKISRKEYEEVTSEVEKLGFANGWIQGYTTDHERFLGTNIKPV